MNYVTAGLVAFITLLGGFYGGYRYEAAKVPATPAAASNATNGTGTGSGRFAGGFAGGAFGGGAGGAGFGGRGGAGTVSNLTASGFTLTTPGGTTTKVTFGSGMTVRKTVDGATSDLQDNLTVTVSGQRDASGNLTASTVTIIPAITASPSPAG